MHAVARPRSCRNNPSCRTIPHARADKPDGVSGSSPVGRYFLCTRWQDLALVITVPRAGLFSTRAGTSQTEHPDHLLWDVIPHTRGTSQTAHQDHFL